MLKERNVDEKISQKSARPAADDQNPVGITRGRLPGQLVIG